MIHVKTSAVIGWPIRHSRSPLIHNFWLKQHGLQGAYHRIAVPPEEIDGFLGDLERQGLVGCNVTIPHKEAAFRAARELDPVARELGVVNTLWLEDGVLHGANTDVPGFLANLDQSAPDWDANPGKAVMLGAGGAARAVLHGLISRGFEVHIANRTREKAEAMAAHYSGKAVAHGFHELERLLSGVGLLVNTTSLGMEGQPPLDIDLSPLSDQALVTDIVYTPLITPMLDLAGKRGLRTVYGLGMLLHQAVPGFEHWFGLRPVVTEDLRALIVEDILSPKQDH